VDGKLPGVLQRLRGVLDRLPVLARTWSLSAAALAPDRKVSTGSTSEDG